LSPRRSNVIHFDHVTGLYALYAGLVVIAVTGLLLAPGIHHIMKRVHWEEGSTAR